MYQNFRLFVEKKPSFNLESEELSSDLRHNLHIKSITKIRVINIYEVFALRQSDLDLAQNIVFAESPVDNIYVQTKGDALPLNLAGNLNGQNNNQDNQTITPYQYFALEYLPGQYDQRSDSALQCLQLLDINNPNLQVTSGKLIIIYGNLNVDDMVKIKKYYINPIEMQEKNLTLLAPNQENVVPSAVPRYTEFNQLTPSEMFKFIKTHNLAMTIDDLCLIQRYFKDEVKRVPTETEIKVLDTYWSDHCRHTTFTTHLNSITLNPGPYQQLLQTALDNYLNLRQKVYGDKAKTRPITLMDMATIFAKAQLKDGNMSDVEVSDEINACSVLVPIQVDGVSEVWSLQFKNETHNHPTEIEPFGGASTCVGGAIRDPLSGRSYVYQAMRISGAANILENIEDTLPGKLPQKVISTKAAHGFSAYGNQIGLATTYVQELYHPGYAAKRMEVGMVIGANKYTNIVRDTPQESDVIILLGGRTGRDGCGGASGSSKEHTVQSAQVSSSEVQKGNPITERKIQRLFRQEACTKLIKKCNDFGAGGVCVAIGELAPGVIIDLDKVLTKYTGLSGTELAISESQERMAVVVRACDTEVFINYATLENLEATIVAHVTAEPRLVMYYKGEMIVSLDRHFLDTNGALHSTSVSVESPQNIAEIAQSILNPSQCVPVNQPGSPNGAPHLADTLINEWHKNLSKLNTCSKRGLIEMFDASIGAGSVLMPLGGKTQLTPTQVSVQKFPVMQGQTNNVTVAAYGFDPYLSSWSPFHGALYAVIDSVTKCVASGADFRQIKFSFQEYFEKLGDDYYKWGKPCAAMLGALYAQEQFGLAAIGGKDSMSGSFHDLNVPPTLISFAVTPSLASLIISPEFKGIDNYVYLVKPTIDANYVPDFPKLLQNFIKLNQYVVNKQVLSMSAVGIGGIALALSLMCFGNSIGFMQHQSDDNCNITDDIGQNNQTTNNDWWFVSRYGAIIIESHVLLEDVTLVDSSWVLLGKTTKEPSIQLHNDVHLKLSDLIATWEEPLAHIFKTKNQENRQSIKEFEQALTKFNNFTVATTNLPPKPRHATIKVAKPRVLVPVFPGTNCEYDSMKAFNQASAVTQSMVFNNLSLPQIKESIDNLAKNINNSQILMLSGGFSAGDEPDGSAKFIATVLRNNKISDAIYQLLERDGLILGICNGFQALIKSGLLPDGKIANLTNSSPTLTYNTISRHMSKMVTTKIINNTSPWLNSFTLGQCHTIAISHGEGKFIVDPLSLDKLYTNGQIATCYVDADARPSLNSDFNPNGANYAIEGLTSPDGRILGKMGHSERYGNNLYKNIRGNTSQDIFSNGVNYFR